MKRKSGALIGSDDKKARWEAGLDLDLSKDWEDLQVENILREVRAPPAVQTQITEWLNKLSQLLSNYQSDKILVGKLRSKLLSCPDAAQLLIKTMPDETKFPGGQVVDVWYMGSLLAPSSLVFPAASGHTQLLLTLRKHPKNDVELKKMMQCFLAVLWLHLNTKSQLISKVGLCQPVWEEDWPALLISPTGKLAAHLTITIGVRLCPDLSTNLTDGGLALRLQAVQAGRAGLQAELGRLMTSQAAYREAGQLMEVWGRQVGLQLPPNLLPTVLLHCHLTNQLTPTMKVWQLVRRLWTFLSDQLDAVDQQIILGVLKPVPADASQSPLLNRDGSTALFPDFPLCQWRNLASWSRAALTAPLKETLLVSHKAGALFDRIFLLEGDTLQTGQLLRNLESGLANRITRIAAFSEADAGTTSCWNGRRRLMVGLSLDPATAFVPATHGPESGDPKAEAFRAFWGERSQLRRFQDGVVKEVVVWGDKKEEIIGEVVLAVVARHHPGVEVDEKAEWHRKLLVGDGGAAAKQELDVLVPIIYGLEGLPLAVSGVTAFSAEGRLSRVGAVPGGWGRPGGKIVAEHRGTGQVVVGGKMAPHAVQPLDVLLTTEQSGKWPRDEDAVRRLRVAWLQEVGKALSAKVEGVKQRIIGEQLVLVTPSREVVLRFTAGEKGKGGAGHLSQLTSWLAGVARSHPAWSGGVRLAKRWVSAQLMSTCIPDTAVEVIMAKIFLMPGAFGSAPTSSVCAFYRWLELVSAHDWNDAPLVVSPDALVPPERSKLPPLAVITPHEPEPSHWTSPGPSWPELQRLVLLAAGSLQLLQEKDGSRDIESLFTPCLDSYECIIHLKPLQVANRHLSIASLLAEEREKKHSKEKSDTIPVTDFNPAQLYVSELRGCYGHLANFYYDQYGGMLITVKFKPRLKTRAKVSELGGLMSRGSEMEVNWGAILEDWQILGSGLVKSITCKDVDQFL